MDSSDRIANKKITMYSTSVLTLIGVLGVYEVLELLWYTLHIYLIVFYCIFMCVLAYCTMS